MGYQYSKTYQQTGVVFEDLKQKLSFFPLALIEEQEKLEEEGVTRSLFWCFILSLTGHAHFTGACKRDDDCGDFIQQHMAGF